MFNLYTKYYFIPWPESQRFMELDPDWEHTIMSESADLFAECEWVDNLERGNCHERVRDYNG